ncbi:MAG: GNAT family N-acetyltransferase [Clostridia bacterium]|nr:GNAT family N-acetyltransferase [Clostridia bacterium]
MIKTEVFLDSIKKSDLTDIQKWFSDEQFLKNYHYEIIRETSLKSLKKLYIKNNEKVYRPFAIRLEGEDEIVGITELFDISDKNRTAWISVGIGNGRFQGKGYGKQAMIQTIDYAFNKLNLRKLQLAVIGYNDKAISLYEGLGFVKEGAFRKLVLFDNKEYDLNLYGILKQEWKQGK